MASPNAEKRSSRLNRGVPDGYQYKLLLTDEPEKLDRFITTLGDPGHDLYLLHSLRARWRSVGPQIEKSLGFLCPYCSTMVEHYSGEWQERAYCGWTMQVLPLALVELLKALNAEIWTEQIRQAQAVFRDRGVSHGF